MKNEVIKAPNLTKVLKPYENKWVALSTKKDKVVSSGNTLKEVIQKLSQQEREKVSFMKVFPFDAGYAPHAV
ncbi:MAG: DUF5678 domain-containing protein [Patescibacteria group bacterium]